MPKPRRTWGSGPKKAPKPSVPDWIKIELSEKAGALVEQYLKPAHVPPPPKNAQYNYLIDITTRWRGRYFYFCATYACPGPHAISPTFEIQFARLEYAGNKRFHLAFMRHTEKWWVLYDGLTIDECLTAIREEPHFHP
jgi:hypothetical protein